MSNINDGHGDMLKAGLDNLHMEIKNYPGGEKAYWENFQKEFAEYMNMRQSDFKKQKELLNSKTKSNV